MLDFAAWRELTSVEDLGASHNVARNLIAAGGQPETVRSPRSPRRRSGSLGSRRLMGRYLLPEDERPGAPGAIVIGHDVWVAASPAIRISSGGPFSSAATTHAIVGVMPPGLRVPDQSQLLGAVAHEPCSEYRAANRPVDERLREARAGRHARERAVGAEPRWGNAWRRRRRPRISTSARESLPYHLRVQRHGRSRERAGAACHPDRDRHAAGDRLRERGDSGLCADRDAAGRDRGPQRARRQPPAHRRAAVHRSTGAGGSGRRRRPRAACRSPSPSSTPRWSRSRAACPSG